MKKAHLLVPAFLLLLSSCAAPKYPQYSLGITEKEFVQKNSGVELIETSAERTVYRKRSYPFGKPAQTRFFYFVDGKLVQMDEGVRRADITIQHVND